MANLPKPIGMQRYRPERHGPKRQAIDHLEGMPEKPSDLPAEAEDMWDRILVLLRPLDVVTEIDGYALEMTCRTWAEYKQAVRQSDARQIKELVARFISLSQHFGLTPAARTRLRNKEIPKTNELDEFGIVG